MMSHEIRTPRNGVLGFTSLLKETTQTAARREYVSTLESSGQHLRHLINDILDLSKIENGKLRTPLDSSEKIVADRFPGRKTLIVDDDPVCRKLCKLQLGKLGFETDTPENGLEAVRKCDEQRFDAIRVEVPMPGMDGFSATREIRRRETRYRTPIVALTANAMPEDRERSLEAGMDDYVAKPMRVDSFSQVLTRWLSASPSRLSFPFGSPVVLCRTDGQENSGFRIANAPAESVRRAQQRGPARGCRGAIGPRPRPQASPHCAATGKIPARRKNRRGREPVAHAFESAGN